MPFFCPFRDRVYNTALRRWSRVRAPEGAQMVFLTKEGIYPSYVCRNKLN